MRFVVLVNGPPGTGKTTLARPLARALGLPLLAKDAVKETLAAVLGSGRDGLAQRQWSQQVGAAAMETIWTLLADSSVGGVVEANLLAQTRPLAQAGLARAGIEADDLTEVWCELPLALARARFEQREPLRHEIHGPQVGLSELWTAWSDQAIPLGLGRVIRVDTRIPVDVDELAAAIRTAHNPSLEIEPGI